MSTDDRTYMELALAEAREALGRTSPNPPVGAVLVRDGVVVARGHTAPAGGPHAEIVALKAAGEKARGATLYTTLEPCSHQGRTGPCTTAITEAGVGRVVVGSRDLNPLVSGRGIQKLRRAGIEVLPGVLESVCDRHNAPFFTWVRRHRPYVVLKAASTLDGRIATRTGDSRWVTGPAARARSHEWRDQLDAILVGAGTVTADDPRLNARPEGRAGRDPIRVVLDGKLSTDPAAKIYRLRSKAPTWLVVGEKVPEAKVEPFRALPRVEVIRLPAVRGRIDPADLLAELARREVVSVLVEGGGKVHGAFLEAGLVDEVRVFLAPKVLGEGPSWLDLGKGRGPERMADAWSFADTEAELVGDDLLLTGFPTRRQARPKRSAVSG